MSLGFEDSEVIADGPVSIVTRIKVHSQWFAVKTSTTTHAKEPHDILKEARLLAETSHPNIISLIEQEISERQSLSLRMPYVPYSLYNLLQLSTFSPRPLISFESTDSSIASPREQRFVVLAKSIIFQVLCAVSYLHTERIQIAHRDIKPSNILLTASGRVQLIDFGIAFGVGEEARAKNGDLWPESADRMYFEVSTGPYRAPELLFGPRTYDAFAIDSWSLGVTFSEFFTPLRLLSGDDDDDDDDFESDPDSESDSEPAKPMKPLEPFIIPKGARAGNPRARWTRDSLFNGERGEIALAWSIFKTRGTPNETNWPSFMNLPDASKVTFVDAEAMDLGLLLPNLPPSISKLPMETKTHAPPPEMIPSPLDLIHRFLVYEPSTRLRPSDASNHPWFTSNPGLVLPDDCTLPLSQLTNITSTSTWDNQTLGDLLRGMNLPAQCDGGT
ncbi:hypothetical protein HYDPIDRAFT_26943 [Hydnomerulius pinastri MD-312]|nr:hypothetical protein HYDPIDRAFT_26943 [Hydnomerulius pinastri MD-312]